MPGFYSSNLESGKWRRQGPQVALSAMWQASNRCDCMAAVKQKKKAMLFTILELMTDKIIEKVELRGKIKTKVNKNLVTNMGNLKYDFSVNFDWFEWNLFVHEYLIDEVRLTTQWEQVHANNIEKASKFSVHG